MQQSVLVFIQERHLRLVPYKCTIRFLAFYTAKLKFINHNLNNDAVRCVFIAVYRHIFPVQFVGPPWHTHSALHFSQENAPEGLPSGASVFCLQLISQELPQEYQADGEAHAAACRRTSCSAPRSRRTPSSRHPYQRQGYP